MTIIQPNKNKPFWNKVLIALGAAIMSAGISIIIIYNQNVEFDHEAERLNTELQDLQTADAELKEKFFELLSSNNLEKLASERQLIKETKPRYLEVNQKWVFASQQ